LQPGKNRVFVFFVVFCLKSSPTERKFSFPPRNSFTEGNEGNEGGSGPAKYSLCFLRYLLFKILSDAENLFLQKETKVTKVFAAGQEQSLCFLRCLLFKIFSDASAPLKFGINELSR
jgi:hypothetical protein